MSIKCFVLTAAAFLLPNALAFAQHEGHQIPAQGPGQIQTNPSVSASVSEIERLNLLIESARQANDPARIRAAIDDVQNSLAALRTNLLASTPANPEMDHSQMNVEGMDHSKMNMPGMKPRPKSPSASQPSSEKQTDHMDMKDMDHSKMNMRPFPQSPPTSGAKPSAESQMDHSHMDMPGMSAPRKPEATSGSASKADAEHPTAAETKDSVCFTQAGTSSHKATYQGKTYYFCSKADREKFLADPQKYVKR